MTFACGPPRSAAVAYLRGEQAGALRYSRCQRYNAAMTAARTDALRTHDVPALDRATLVLALTGWMDGGDVSTGTVRRLVDLLGARPVADIDPEPFYIYNFPGSMELAALFRPPVKIEDGKITSLDLPENTFYCHEPAQLVLILDK